MIILNMANIGSESMTIALVGYVIVFVALVILVLVFSNLPKLINREAKKRMRKRGLEVPENEPIKPISGEENAAIAMALYLFFNEMHDEESNIITIRKVSRTYSPWSSKIYGLNSLDRRRY